MLMADNKEEESNVCLLHNMSERATGSWGGGTEVWATDD